MKRYYPGQEWYRNGWLFSSPPAWSGARCLTMRQVVTSTHSGARGLFSDWPDPAKDGRRVFLPDSDSRKSFVRFDCLFIQSSHSVDEDHAVLFEWVPESWLGHDHRDGYLHYPGMCRKDEQEKELIEFSGKDDVMPFIKDQNTLNIWSTEYFLQLADMVKLS